MAQQDIEVILLRQWADLAALPIFVADPDGVLLFYNEPAEVLLGRRFDEAGDLPISELARVFETTTEDGRPISSGELPIAVALRERRPQHARLRMKALDGSWRTVEVTAFPIGGRADRHLGVVAMFWEAHNS